MGSKGATQTPKGGKQAIKSGQRLCKVGAWLAGASSSSQLKLESVLRYMLWDSYLVCTAQAPGCSQRTAKSEDSCG